MDKTNSQNFNALSFSRLRTYSDPVLHKTGKWYIDFRALDPVTGIFKRKKYYVKCCSSLRQRNKVASEMMVFLATNLSKGWSPWAAEDYSSNMMTFSDCLDKYVQHVSRMSKQHTRESYLSRVSVLRQYIKTQIKPILMAYQFDTAFCCGFLDYIYIEKGDFARTRNNYRDWLFTLAEFLRQRNNISFNPVEPIGKLKEDVKYRKALTGSMLGKLSSYLKKHDRFFYLACLMEYYALIRPNELSQLRIKDIKLYDQTVCLSQGITKNGKDDTAALNKKIILHMLDLDVLTKPADYFLFSLDCKPGKEHADSDQFNRKWKAVREALGWSDRYQFYSLKDSGIRDLANDKGIIVARDQARHADIATTNKYIQEHPVHECVKEFNGLMD